jgi:transcriptional regulator NrdR family protein
MNINIIKSSGERVPFSRQKLYDSLMRSGANEQLINGVIQEIEPLLYEIQDTFTEWLLSY